MTRSSVPWKSARTLPSADSTVEDWAAGRAAGRGTLPMNRAKTATAPAAKPAAAQSHHRRTSQTMIRPPRVLGCARRRCRWVGAGGRGALVLGCVLTGLPPTGALALGAALGAGVLAAFGAPLGALAPAAGLRRGGSDRDWPATGMHRLLGLRSSGALGPGPRWPGLCADNSCENLQEVGPQPRDRQLPHHTEGNDQQGVPEPQPAKLRPRR